MSLLAAIPRCTPPPSPRLLPVSWRRGSGSLPPPDAPPPLLHPDAVTTPAPTFSDTQFMTDVAEVIASKPSIKAAMAARKAQAAEDLPAPGQEYWEA